MRPANYQRNSFCDRRGHVAARSHRRASVLLVVLVVIVLLALGAYTFSETMISESQAVAMHGRKVESRVLADSGVQYVAAMLQQRFDFAAEGVFDNPERLQDVLLVDAEAARGRGRFSVITPRRAGGQSAFRFGLTDESSKLNLNQVAAQMFADQASPEESREFLLAISGMTVETADAVLDWLDADDIPRKYGAETEYYARLTPPYTARNGPLVSLDELLLVRGITSELMDGQDDTESGRANSGDNNVTSRRIRSEASSPSQGWRALLTVDSREGNLRRDGRPKINVNQESLETLHEQVAFEFGDDLAEFVVAYRSQRPAANAVPDNRAASAGIRASRNIAGTRRINSLYQLVGAAFAVDGDVPDWESPWTIEPADLRRYLPELLDKLTTHDGRSREGRININLASREVLRTVPGLDESLIELIVGAQAWNSRGAPVGNAANSATTAWLLIEGHVDVAKMQQLDRYITARGDVYRGQVLGYFDEGETITRLETIIDATYQVPRVVSLQDLTHLGPGVTRLQLKQGSDGVNEY